MRRAMAEAKPEIRRYAESMDLLQVIGKGSLELVGA
jgi:hypothetical protein